MRAFQVKKLAHPRDITLSDDVPPPIAQKSQVIVDVYATGLNFFDVLQAQGKYQNRPPLPFILGAELAGRIAEDSPIPKGCPFQPGGGGNTDRVHGFGAGAYAEQVASAVIPLTYTTSYDGLVHRGQMKENEWVLVHAGAGGVGLAACQIAKVLGAKVIATASTEEKRRICRDKARVDAVVDYTQTGWQKEVMKITSGNGVDIVYDPVGMIIPSLKCVNWNARIVVVGFAAGTIEKVPANLLLLKQVSIVGLFWGGGTERDPRHAAEVVLSLSKLFSSGRLKPILYEPIYEGLESVSKALTDLDERKIWGKGVVRVMKEQSDSHPRVKPCFECPSFVLCLAWTKDGTKSQ
ncbi:alcohol dehydrogenase [Kockovaella imperatae]|uniref:Alcohol dehydrogenase n=1 Tax=Kockovaella imperatae TaxID=4999 RepID=A0A1Y1UFM3_9TREE|nr:alcohol dehydrogenase [Kockovaella imperatae]ORX36818.1 alcohol dehydrogenase [Kockovaella imperatae]